MSTNKLLSALALSEEALSESNLFLHDVAEFLWGEFFLVRENFGSALHCIRLCGGVEGEFCYFYHLTANDDAQ
jgi:hypothetical protein